MSIKGRVVDVLSQVAVVSPLRSQVEGLLKSAAHRFPTSRTVGSFCHHFGIKLMEHEGQSFERIATLGTGGRMYCDTDKQIGLLNLRFYFSGTLTGQTEDERPIVELMSRWVRPGDVFFDLGANLGFYSCFVSPLCGPSGAIHAFEANPRLIPNLRRSIELNKEWSRIKLNATAVGRESNTSLTLYGIDRIGSSSLHPHGWLDKDSAVTVPVISIDSYVKENKISRIDVMKVDIEGAELEAFQGMEHTFKLCPPGAIVCELMPAGVSDRASSAAPSREIADYLSARGYEAFTVVDVNGQPRLRAISSDMIANGTHVTNVVFVLPIMKSERSQFFLPHGS